MFDAARAIDRKGELALRAALGAPRLRLLRPIWIEATLVGLVGAVAALALTWGALALAVRLVPRLSIPLAIDLSPSVATALLAVASSWILGTLAGLAPAAAVGRSDRLTDAIGFVRGARRTKRLRTLFVVGQLALALVLVAAGIALGRGAAASHRAELGFDPRGVHGLALETAALPGDAASRLALARSLEQRAHDSGAVEAAGLAGRLPFSFGRPTITPRLESGVEAPALDTLAISPGALDAFGIRLLEGRPFAIGDDAEAPAVALVDRAAAERLWPGESALGRRLRLGSDESATTVEVVGVTASVRLHRPWLAPNGQLFRPLAQSAARRLALVVRSRASSAALDRELLPALAAGVPDLPLGRFEPLAERIDLVQLPQRIAGHVASTLSFAALALSAIGLAGLVARLVSERKRELAIRVALGADRRAIARLVLGESIRLGLWGAALGLPLALGVGALLAAALERVRPADPVALVASALAIGTVALAAAALPARRAALLPPADILRGE